MSTYIGTPGALSPIKCAASMKITSAQTAQESITLGGRRKAIVRQNDTALRVWTLNVEVATGPDLLVLDQAAMLSEPVTLVDPWMAHTNLLLPQQANCQLDYATSNAKLTFGVKLKTENGHYLTGVQNNDQSQFIYFDGSPTGRRRTPVIPGQKITATVFVQSTEAAPGLAKCLLRFYDGAGTLITQRLSPGAPRTGTLQRETITATVPDAAVGAAVAATNSALAAGPAITWTDRAVPAAPGAGVTGVLILPPEINPFRATKTQQLASVTYEAWEVK